MGHPAHYPQPTQLPFWSLNASIKDSAAEKTSQEATAFVGSNGIHWKLGGVL